VVLNRIGKEYQLDQEFHYPKRKRVGLFGVGEKHSYSHVRAKGYRRLSDQYFYAYSPDNIARIGNDVLAFICDHSFYILV